MINHPPAMSLLSHSAQDTRLAISRRRDENWHRVLDVLCWVWCKTYNPVARGTLNASSRDWAWDYSPRLCTGSTLEETNVDLAHLDDSEEKLTSSCNITRATANLYPK